MIDKEKCRIGVRINIVDCLNRNIHSSTFASAFDNRRPAAENSNKKMKGSICLLICVVAALETSYCYKMSAYSKPDWFDLTASKVSAGSLTGLWNSYVWSGPFLQSYCVTI